MQEIVLFLQQPYYTLFVCLPCEMQAGAHSTLLGQHGSLSCTTTGEAAEESCYHSACARTPHHCTLGRL